MAAPVAARAAAGASGGARAAGGASKGAGKSGGAGKGRAAPRGRAEGDGKATKSDIAGMKSRARAADAGYQAAYDAAVAGDPPDPSWDQATRDAYDSGVDERRTQQREVVGDRARSVAGDVATVRGPDFVNDGAGFVLGLLVYALALNFLQGGSVQARAWLAAKFLNRVAGR